MTLDSPHRRLNPLTGEWVLVSPHRAKRPWLGQVERAQPENLPPYDPTCYLCPGNERAGGLRNPDYLSTFVFDNDFAALLPDEIPPHASDHPLLTAASERGICRVVCFSPRHDLTLPELDKASIENVIAAWTEQSVGLGAKHFIDFVQVFENKGALMGCSNPHPHSQIWATEYLPTEPAKELANEGVCKRYRAVGILRKAKRKGIFANVTSCPVWAIWPFEVMVVAHRMSSIG
jgi:UDPglucose--hexose-1-phosphate uridylyltransferase